MKKTLTSSCGCQTASEPSQPAGDQSGSNCGDASYACDKFTDPKWIKLNIDYFPVGFEARNGRFENLSPKETVKVIRKTSNTQSCVILDVKTEQEYDRLHLPGSIHLDFFSPTFKDDLFSLDKETSYVVICKIGMRSEITMNLMKKMGFKHVYNVIGGDDRWTDEEIPGHTSQCMEACQN